MASKYDNNVNNNDYLFFKYCIYFKRIPFCVYNH